MSTYAQLEGDRGGRIWQQRTGSGTLVRMAEAEEEPGFKLSERSTLCYIPACDCWDAPDKFA